MVSGICTFCSSDRSKDRFSPYSHGDIVMHFTSFRVWVMPDNILHLIADHGFQPPQAFIDDVMTSVLIDGWHCPHFETLLSIRIGYLLSDFTPGAVNEEFVLKFQRLIHQINETSTRGVTV